MNGMHAPRKKNTVGKVVKGLVTTAVTVHGAYGQPQQSSDTTQHLWAKTAMLSEADRQANDLRDATNARGVRVRDGHDE